MSFAALDLGFAYGLRGVSFQFPERGLITVAGPNGAGKSTLLGILARLRRPYTGSARYQGRELLHWARRDFARKVAFVPQALAVEFPFTVEEMVLMGRSPFAQGWFETPADHAAAEHAMQLTDCLAFRRRDARSLSGGERQRVILAAALAQEPQALLLDEPATYLDLKHQFALYQLLAQLSERMLVIAVTHDLNLALQFATHTLLLHAGQVAAFGSPQEILTPDRIAQVFDISASLAADPHGRRWIHYSRGAE